MDIMVQLTAVHDFLNNTDLLLELFVGIIVVRINDTGRIEQIVILIQGIEGV